jgi:hypothetical protein
MKKMSAVLFPVFFLTYSCLAIDVERGDLILGFRADGGQGADTNLEVNLGPASGITTAGTTILTRLAVADLVSTYGANWATRSDLSWGVIGTTGVNAVSGVPARTIWASAPETTAGTASEPWTRASVSGLQNSSNAIDTMYSGASGSLERPAPDDPPPTPNSAFTAKINSALPGSWSVQEDLVSGNSFRRFTPTVRKTGNSFPAEGSAYDGTGYAVLDLWEVQPGTSGAPATLVGGIGLNSAGKLVFSTDITKFKPPGGGQPLGEPTIVRNPNGSITVTLTNVPDGNYILQRSPTMAAGDWTTLFTQPPVTGTLTFTDPAPPPPRGFYRIGTAP